MAAPTTTTTTSTAALQAFPPRFRDPARERAFRAQQLPAALPLVRLALGVGLAIYLAFGLVDPLVYDTHLASVHLSRYAVGAPAILAALALTWTPAFRRWGQAILCAAVATVGATIIAQVLMDPGHGYYVGLILLMFFAYLFLRIRYLLATAVALALVLGCIGGVALAAAPATAAHVTHAFFLVGGFLVAALIAYIHEVSLRREYLQRCHIEEQQSHLHTLAYHDDTTGLANRHRFRERLRERLAQAACRDETLAVAVLGLDRLREISDMYGRGGGDALLRAVGGRLSAALPPGATVARLEGPDFALDLGPVADADRLAERIAPVQRALAEPFTIAGGTVSVRARIGASLYPEHGADPDQLIQAATTAMGTARAGEPGSWRTYSGDMSTHVAARLQLEQELRAAVQRREFVLHYQPQVDVHTGAVVGVEALLRWQHPRRGLLGPGEFLWMLEESGLMGPVGHWTIDAALAQYRRWLHAGERAWPIAVNLSPRQVHEDDLVTRLDRALAAEPVGGRALQIELTETAAMIDPERTADTLQRLHERGIESALDDFGKGYSSLGQLRHLPVSTIKIDKAFLAGLPEHKDNRALVDTIVTMAHYLGKRVLAEGVTSEIQHRYLARIGCDYAQGALFGMPRPAMELPAAPARAPLPLSS